ncbi:hypothetical protein CW304_11800 [Bacillus sp. UFRGS-B20]|nr:hypothetical protein CW304_11800 [Bacillus sp. UFRGS-B20]
MVFYLPQFHDIGSKPESLLFFKWYLSPNLGSRNFLHPLRDSYHSFPHKQALYFILVFPFFSSFSYFRRLLNFFLEERRGIQCLLFPL